MKTTFTKRANKGLEHWLRHDLDVYDKISNLIDDIEKTPFKGLGKPEPLKGNYSGCWSRRITQEHRLIYRVEGQDEAMVITVLQCRYHYTD